MARLTPCLTGTVTQAHESHQLTDCGVHTLQGQERQRPRTTEDWAPGE